MLGKANKDYSNIGSVKLTSHRSDNPTNDKRKTQKNGSTRLALVPDIYLQADDARQSKQRVQ